MDSDGVQLEDNVEFTLEDTLENLKDIQKDLKLEVDELVHRTSNNATRTLSLMVTSKEIMNRTDTLNQSLTKNLYEQSPRDFPLLNTMDLFKIVIKDFGNEINDMEELSNAINADVADIKNNIAQLQCKKEGLAKMKNACLGATENVGAKTYDNEIAVTKRVFRAVKDDLYTVVDKIFPGHNGFKDFLGDLTSAYMRGGDDVYIEMLPDNLTFAKFLIEADIAMYHPNDKTQIRMTDML